MWNIFILDKYCNPLFITCYYFCTSYLYNHLNLNSLRSCFESTPFASTSKRYRDSLSPLSPSEITQPEQKATVQALLTSLSASKKNTTFFQGELTDGNTVIPLIGFDNVHKKLSELMANNVPASLKNCQVSLNKITGKPQVVIKSYTVIDEAGNADIKVDDPATLGSPSLTVDKLDTLDVYDRVTLCVTVLQVKDPVQVSTGKTKQEVIIGDKTGNVTLTLWEHDINTLQENCSYQLSRVQVHEFSGRRELSLPSFGATINPIEDLQDICRVHSEEDNTKPLVNAFIVAVNQLAVINNDAPRHQHFQCFHY